MTLEYGGATVSIQWMKLQRTVPTVWSAVCFVFYPMKLLSGRTFCLIRWQRRIVHRRLQGTPHAESGRRGF